MVFNSLTFLVFFLSVLTLYYLLPRWQQKKRLLLLASYLFYSAWNPFYVFLIALSTIVDWLVAKRLGAEDCKGAHRRLYLLLSLTINLGLLGFFKYDQFLLANFQRLVAIFGFEFNPPKIGFVLPVGISFYTFQTLSYTIDVFRKRIKPVESFCDFALFVAFFPQLVAGPIVRASEFLPQLRAFVRPTKDQFYWGFTLLLIGVFQKVLLADTFLAPISDKVFANPNLLSIRDAWIGALAFSGQIFFDFAGYSTSAIGVAMCFGFSLPDNFRSPYAAIGFRDFWRRWHVSLSSWLRDYVYIPLGGNRHGQLRTIGSVMLTMFLGGLWHGAAWRFVAWGLLHGTFLVIELLLTPTLDSVRCLHGRTGRTLAMLSTYILVTIAWVLFRASTLGQAFAILKTMFALTESPAQQLIPPSSVFVVAFVVVVLLLSHLLLRRSSVEHMWSRLSWWNRSFLVTALTMGILLSSGGQRAFIYFRF